MIILMRPDPDLNWLLGEISKKPILSRKEEISLLSLAHQGNEAASRKLCAHNLRFVVKVAKGFRGSGIPFQDLINEGTIGLYAAVQRFDPSTGLRFLSYAVWWIRAHITRAITEKSKLIRITAEHEAPLRRLKKAPLRQMIGGGYLEDIETEKTRIKPSHLAASLIASRGGLSLDQPVTHSGATPADIIPSEAPQPDQLTHNREWRDILNRLRGKLTPDQRQVITLNFGLDGGPCRTLREIAEQMSRSHERIRQIRNAAIAKMREIGGKYADKPNN